MATQMMMSAVTLEYVVETHDMSTFYIMITSARAWLASRNASGKVLERIKNLDRHWLTSPCLVGAFEGL